MNPQKKNQKLNPKPPSLSLIKKKMLFIAMAFPISHHYMKISKIKASLHHFLLPLFFNIISQKNKNKKNHMFSPPLSYSCSSP
jgi:hypothetical protein